MFSTDFIFRQQKNLVHNQKCQTGFMPLCNKKLIMALDTTPFTPGVRIGFSPLGNFAGYDLVECSVHHPPEALALTLIGMREGTFHPLSF